MNFRPLFQFDNPEAVSRWLGEDEGKQVFKDLREWRATKANQLKTATDLITIGRLQGCLEILDRLISLREEISNAVVPKR